PAGSSPGLLTTRGWALAAGNLALLIAGRLLGVRELFELGLGLSTLVIAACIIVRRGGHDTRLARAVDPLEVYPGSLVRVEVSIRAGARRSPPLLFVEELPPAQARSLRDRPRLDGGHRPVRARPRPRPPARQELPPGVPGDRGPAADGRRQPPLRRGDSPAPGADAGRRRVLHHAGVPARRRRAE